VPKVRLVVDDFIYFIFMGQNISKRLLAQVDGVAPVRRETHLAELADCAHNALRLGVEG